VKERFEFIFGDYSNDGHGQYEIITCEIEHDNSVEILTRLQQDEEKLVSEFNLDMDNWLLNYEDNELPAEVVEKFNDLNISYNKFDLTETGELQFFSVDDFFYIWKQLINLVDKDIKIEKVMIKQFFSKCSGYGIYD
jgi:hypothetical protein